MRAAVSIPAVAAASVSHSAAVGDLVGYPLGSEISAKTCSLLGNEGTPPDFERFFLEKRP